MYMRFIRTIGLTTRKESFFSAGNILLVWRAGMPVESGISNSVFAVDEEHNVIYGLNPNGFEDKVLIYNIDGYEKSNDSGVSHCADRICSYCCLWYALKSHPVFLRLMWRL